MAQISSGFTYTSTGTNSLVTAGNLNQHVNNAQLVGGAISEQTANPVSADSDLLLIFKSGALYSQSKLQFTDTINSDEINVNTLSAELAEVDNLTLTGTLLTGGWYPTFDVKRTNIVAKGAVPTIRFGFDSYTGAPPIGSSYLNLVTFGTRTLQVFNPDVGSGPITTVQVVGEVLVLESSSGAGDASLEVYGPIYSNGELVMTGAPVAAKTGTVGVFGSSTLHKTQEFEIPADETWIFTFLAHWTTGQTGNTRPDGYYTVTAIAEKATYADVTLKSWTKLFPSYGALGFINVVLPLTAGDLANLPKRLRFDVSHGLYNGDYSITLQKVKTSSFTTSSSIL